MSLQEVDVPVYALLSNREYNFIIYLISHLITVSMQRRMRRLREAKSHILSRECIDPYYADAKDVEQSSISLMRRGVFIVIFPVKSQLKYNIIPDTKGIQFLFRGSFLNYSQSQFHFLEGILVDQVLPNPSYLASIIGCLCSF